MILILELLGRADIALQSRVNLVPAYVTRAVRENHPLLRSGESECRKEIMRTYVLWYSTARRFLGLRLSERRLLRSYLHHSPRVIVPYSQRHCRLVYCNNARTSLIQLLSIDVASAEHILQIAAEDSLFCRI